MKEKYKYVIGIDEVGRGPLAGPVGVGVVLVPQDFDFKIFQGLRDSKKMKVENREAIFHQAEKLKKQKILDFAVTLTSAPVIDKIGIVPAINLAMEKSLQKILKSNPRLELDSIKVFLDGGLKAPVTFSKQETVIKGDDLVPAISLASVLAKVTRDSYMKKTDVRADLKKYHFAQHKGYGTKLHLMAIAENGLSLEHRLSFCRRFADK